MHRLCSQQCRTGTHFIAGLQIAGVMLLICFVELLTSSQRTQTDNFDAAVCKYKVHRSQVCRKQPVQTAKQQGNAIAIAGLQGTA